MRLFRRMGRCPDGECYRERKHRNRQGRRMEEKLANGESIVLADCPEDSKCLIVNNTNKVTKEIGINPGKTIITFKTEPSDSNMIICLDSTRYIIAKSIAEMITVSVIDQNDDQDCRTTG